VDAYSPVIISLPRPYGGGERHLVESETRRGVFYMVMNGTDAFAACTHPSVYDSADAARKCKHIDAVRAHHAASVRATAAATLPAETIEQYRARMASNLPAPVPPSALKPLFG
jgi:hypothetical protein